MPAFAAIEHSQVHPRPTGFLKNIRGNVAMTTHTEVDVFETTIQKTNSLLKDIDEELGWGDRRKQAYAGLRAVLHALRDRLPVTEAANFAAQLPMLVRGFYFEGWKPESVPKKMPS
jgi:hypothetical protein